MDPVVIPVLWRFTSRLIGSSIQSIPELIWMNFSNSETKLVGGIPTPLKNMRSSVGMMTFPYIMEK